MTKLKSTLALMITTIALATGFLAATSPAEARYICHWEGVVRGWVCYPG